MRGALRALDNVARVAPACTELTLADPLCDPAAESAGDEASAVTPQDVPRWW